MTEDPRSDTPRALMAELARIVARLDCHATGAGCANPAALPPPPGPPPGPPADAEDRGPLAQLIDTFGLSPFERDVLLLSAAMELDSACAAAVARAQDGGAPTFALALAAFATAHWSAVLPDAPLRAWNLIELLPGPSLVSRALQINERILHFLLGLDCSEPGLDGVVRYAQAEPPLQPPYQSIAERTAAALELGWSAPTPSAPIQLVGSDASLRQAVAGAAAALLDQPLLILDIAALSPVAAEQVATFRIGEREALLSGGCLLLTTTDEADPALRRTLARLIDAARIPLLLSLEQPLPPGPRGMVTVDIPRNTAAQRLALWQQLVGGDSAVKAELETIAYQFNLSLTAMTAAAQAAKPAPGTRPGHQALWQACRVQARCAVGQIAERIEPVADWSNLILPPREMTQLRALADQVRHRAQVLGQWGFDQGADRGLGIAALFAGTSGTGKTLAAEVLAHDLQLDLYRIDLSAVVDKYIGETEKNLRRIFDAAEAGGAILLFDEADALFGKRSEVKDSHDRHANIEVSYLLQRVEAYSGLAILTSNLKNAVDPAFLRRLRYVIDFPFPDAGQRAAIWRIALPAAMPRRDIEPALLAQLNVAGGTIRSIALNAAFLAAGEGTPLTMTHIKAAARSEYAKLERTLSAAETRGWA